MNLRNLPDLARYYNPMAAFRNSHIEKPNPMWAAVAQSPFEIFIGGYLAVLGLYIITLLTNLAHVENQSQVLQTLPQIAIWNWAIALSLGGMATMVGRLFERFRLEAAGLGFLVYASAVYATTVLYVAGVAGIIAAGAYVMIATSCLARMRVLRLSRKAQSVAGSIIIENNKNGHGNGPR
jgi:hypothetical protein